VVAVDDVARTGPTGATRFVNAPIVFETTTVTVPGHGPAVVWRGGSGSPIVYLHGVMNLTGDEPFLRGMAEHHDVYAPVHPGFADLAELDDIRDVHDLALYYDDLLDALGLQQATVVGHSFGGMAAAELAAHVPDRVAKLVLVAPLGLWNDDHPVADLFALPILEVTSLLFHDAARAPNLFGAVEGPESVVEMLVALLQGLTTAGKFLWPLPDKGLIRRLRRVRAATLVVWGADDRLAPAAYAVDFADAIAGATMEIVDGSGHMVPYERSDELVKIVTAFA